MTPDEIQALLKIEAKPLIQSEVIKGKAIPQSIPNEGKNV